MTNIKGDDAYIDRLFSYFQSKFYEKILKMVPLRNNVFLVYTEKNTYVLKGYPQYGKLRMQEAFTETLQKEGFLSTYTFVSPPAMEQLFFEGMYFGCTKYIVPNKVSFSYHTNKNRKEGLVLLEKFHLITATFEKRYRTLLSQYNLIEKWNERAAIFSHNFSLLRNFINESVLNELQSWAKWSLAGMRKASSLFVNEPFVILHGDVAHHNFLRDSSGKLYLIDFDLISIGPAFLDYLQYANRILPYLDWSIERLAEFRQIQNFLPEAHFLSALAFPADIFREWNRLIRENSYHDQIKLNQVIDLTIGQFSERRQFIDKLIKLA